MSAIDISTLQKAKREINQNNVNEIAREKLIGGAKQTWLILAIKSRDIGKERYEIIKYILGIDGLDVNAKGARGMTALHYVVTSKQINMLEILQMLLDREDINPNITNNMGYTPLHLALKTESIKKYRKAVETIRILIKNDKVDFSVVADNKDILQHFSNLTLSPSAVDAHIRVVGRSPNKDTFLTEMLKSLKLVVDIRKDIDAPSWARLIVDMIWKASGWFNSLYDRNNQAKSNTLDTLKFYIEYYYSKLVEQGVTFEGLGDYGKNAEKGLSRRSKDERYESMIKIFDHVRNGNAPSQPKQKEIIVIEDEDEDMEEEDPIDSISRFERFIPQKELEEFRNLIAQAKKAGKRKRSEFEGIQPPEKTKFRKLKSRINSDVNYCDNCCHTEADYYSIIKGVKYLVCSQTCSDAKHDDLMSN